MFWGLVSCWLTLILVILGLSRGVWGLYKTEFLWGVSFGDFWLPILSGFGLVFWSCFLSVWAGFIVW